MKLRLVIFTAFFFLLLLAPCLIQPASADSPIVGEIRIWAGSSVPPGWLLCDGSKVNVSTYQDLYNVITDTYATGSFIPGSNFYIPDLRGRVPAGVFASQTEFVQLGARGGEISHTLTINEMPAHTHPPSSGDSGFWDYVTSGAFQGVVTSGYAYMAISRSGTGSTGGSNPHNNLQPYLSLNFIIYTGVGLPTATPTATPTLTPTPTATPTPGPGGQTGPITGTITGSLVISQSLPTYAFTTSLSTGNQFVFLRSASYGEIVAGAGGLMLFFGLLFYLVIRAKRSE